MMAGLSPQWCAAQLRDGINDEVHRIVQMSSAKFAHGIGECSTIFLYSKSRECDAFANQKRWKADFQLTKAGMLISRELGRVSMTCTSKENTYYCRFIVNETDCLINVSTDMIFVDMFNLASKVNVFVFVSTLFHSTNFFIISRIHSPPKSFFLTEISNHFPLSHQNTTNFPFNAPPKDKFKSLRRPLHGA